MVTILVLVVYGSSGYCGSLAVEMAAKAPADSIITYADCGYDNMKDDLDATMIAELIRDPQVKAFVDQVKAMVVNSSGINIDIPSGPVATVKNVMAEVKKTGVHLGGRVAGLLVDKIDPEAEIIDGCMYVMFDGGLERSIKLTGLFDKLIADYNLGDDIQVSDVNIGKVGKSRCYSVSPEDDVVITMNIATMGKYSLLAITMGDYQEKYMNILADCSQSNNSKLSAFDGCNISGDDAIVIYNIPKYFETILNVMPESSSESQQIRNMFEKSGMTNMGPIYYRLGFADKQFVLDMVATQYDDFLGMMNPVNMKKLRAVPSDATVVASVNYNLAEMVRFYKTMFDNMPDGVDILGQIEYALSEAETNTGVKVQDGILDNLTGEFVISATCNQYAGLLGTTSVSLMSVRDSQMFMDEMIKLMEFGVAEAGGMVQAECVSSVVDGVLITSLNVPQVMAFGLQPSIAIADKNHIVFGMSPVTTAKSVKLFNSGSDKDTILSNAKFNGAFARSPQVKYGIQYCDSEIALKSVMATANAYWPLAGMALSNFGITLPALPQISTKFDGMPVSYGWTTVLPNGRLYTHMKTDGIMEASLGTAYLGGVGAFAGMQSFQQVQQVQQMQQMQMQMESDWQEQESMDEESMEVEQW